MIHAENGHATYLMPPPRNCVREGWGSNRVAIIYSHSVKGEGAEAGNDVTQFVGAALAYFGS